MGKKSLTGSLALTKLIHVRMTKKGKKGKVEGLFIPIELNLLDQDEKGNVYLPIRAIITDEQDENGQNGFIAKTIGTKRFKEAKKKQQEKWKDYANEETKKVTPIIGNLKDWSSQSNANDSSGAASSNVVDEDDDLPF